MIARKLLGIEWFKARHHSAFWVTTLFPVALLVLVFGIAQSEHARHPERASGFSLPRGWLSLLAGIPTLNVMLVIALVTLLVASERTWRTQRQNVIDGLSRGQFFSAKLLLAGLVAAIFWAIPVVVALVMAVFDGSPGYTDGSGPFLPPLVRQMFAGYFLHLLAVAALAFMFGIIATSSGAALGLAFVFLLGQAPIIGLAMAKGGAWQEFALRLPLMVFGALTERATYDAAVRELMAARSTGMPPGLGVAEIYLWTFAYTGAFVAVAWLAFRRRDL